VKSTSQLALPPQPAAAAGPAGAVPSADPFWSSQLPSESDLFDMFKDPLGVFKSGTGGLGSVSTRAGTPAHLERDTRTPGLIHPHTQTGTLGPGHPHTRTETPGGTSGGSSMGLVSKSDPLCGGNSSGGSGGGGSRGMPSLMNLIPQPSSVSPQQRSLGTTSSSPGKKPPVDDDSDPFATLRG
jgi:hypothetical protein